MNKMLKTYAVVLLAFLSASAHAAKQYNELEDAAVAQAREWQSGGKARPIMSSDGKIVFAYGQSMPKLTCSPTRACDIEMQPNEKVRKVILGDGVNWKWEAADSVENGKPVQHVVFQPNDKNLESNVIITTDKRTYHIKLFSPQEEGIYLNRVGFYYPQELVQSWEDKAGVTATVEAKERSLSVMPAAVSPQKIAFDYRIDGKADFKPVRVFNDGERVFIEMPDSLRNGTNPILMLLDAKGNGMVASYRREEDPETNKVHFVVDKLFDTAMLVSDSDSVKITWKRKEKSFFSWGASQ